MGNLGLDGRIILNWGMGWINRLSNGAISKKIVFFITTDARTSNPTKLFTVFSQ
jgi:hypothetical protein